MKILGRTVYARDGWPLETIIGRPVTNFFRLLFCGSLVNTLHRGNCYRCDKPRTPDEKRNRDVCWFCTNMTEYWGL